MDHELQMTPKGASVLMTPLIWFMGQRNLRATAEALFVRRIADGRRVGIPGRLAPDSDLADRYPAPDDEH